ncbi:MAG: transglutaminase domain-containing protein [Pseudomonadota bacterium]|nr:transglutaminase domain-containing protein [Pseudomonadota bacterium]
MVPATTAVARQPAEVAEVAALVDAGRFSAAEARIASALREPVDMVDDQQVDRLEGLRFQRERMRRILLDFPLDEAAAEASLRSFIPDLAAEEMRTWEADGTLEHMAIDGEKRYFAGSVSNLFRLSPQARSRRTTPPDFQDGPMESLNDHHREIRAAARASDQTSVAPRRLRVTQTLKVNADAVPAGETVRAWIPFPRAVQGQQDRIRLISTEPARHQLAPGSTLQRTVFMEKPARAGQPTEFSVSYELRVHARDHRIDPQRVVDARITPELSEHLGERWPHIMFTPEIRAFSQQVVGEETNPYSVARKLFAAVDDIPWAGAREYSTISNISQHALRTGHADCGQQTLLLMTLLRLNGIPARWQSGMVYSDGDYDNLHDWGQLYLAPYGWVPMDVTTGRLEEGAAEGLDSFYLGGLDAYRIVFNDDYGTPLYPAKQHARSETVDSQRGEVEWRGGNLYFDQWDYSFEAKVLAQDAASR